MHIKTNRIVFSGLLIACFLFSSNLTTNSASAASASITTKSSITLDTSSAGNGVSIDEESINVTTTCTKGYDLTIATSTSTNLYLNGDSTKTAAYTAVDGTSALDSTNNTNKWGYTLTNNATSSTVFSPLSTTASSIRTISQTTNVTSETIPIYYGIKTDNTVDPGTYSMGNNGTITYYLTMNPLCNIVDIAYDGNNADEGTMGAAGTGVIHTGKKDGDTIDLIASNFSRDGYGFAGWSLDKDAGTKLLDNDNTNNPIVYGPQESVTLPEGFIDNDTDNDGIVKLYAVWLQSQGNLQGWAGCANLDTATYDSTTGALDLTKNSVTALTDMRDHDTYAVARLADGQCWMIENLRLEAEDTRGNNRFDSSITNESLAQGYGKSTTYGNFVGLADAESTGFSDTYSANSLYSNDGSNGTTAIGYSDPAYRMPRYNNLNTPANANDRPQNPTSNSFTNNNTTAGMYSYGNYYTWTAAIADTMAYASNDTSATNTSICPAGWHLPKGGDKSNESNNEFWSLIVGGINNNTKPANYDSSTQPYYTGTPEGTDASNKLRAYPNNFLDSGSFSTSYAYDRGSTGRYWSSTASSSDSSYNLNMNGIASFYASPYVSPGTSNIYKTGGFSIRCTVPSNLYAIHFDANTTDTVTGTMANQAIAVDEAARLNSNSFQRPVTSSAAYRFVKWNTEPDGSGIDYTDGASVINLVAAGQTITLYAQWEQVTPMTVNFNGNGLSFDDSSTTNTVYYDNSYSAQTVTKTSHTSNINDDGTQIGTTEYNNNLATKDVITIPGATSLHATITYGTEDNYDMLYVFQGEYTGSVTKNMSAGQLAKYMGGNNTTTTVELDIPGDTATFAFYSDDSGQYWGYHVSVTGVDSSNNPITGEVCERNLISGEYKTPITTDTQEFLGWSENQSATTADYVTADEVLNNLPGNNGETKTLYAIWRNLYTIQYDGNNADNPNGMGTTNTTTGVKSVTQINVGEGDPVTLLASNFKKAGYGFAGWSTNPNATVTSGDKIYGPMETIDAPAYPTNGTNIITMYAVWVPAEKSDPSDPSSSPLYLQDFTASNCNAMTSASFNTATGEITPGSVIALTDKRDDEVYTIAKLADDKCWMIENLRLEHEGTVGNNKNDTSVTNQSLSQGYGGTTGTYGNFVGLATSESANFSNSTTSLSFADGGMYKSSLAPPTDTYNPSTSTLEDIGNSNYPGYRFPRYNNSNNSSALESPTYTENYANATSPSISGTYKTSTISSYGNYYTWAAAMANTNYYTSSSTSEAAGTSICPNNWHLPSSKGTTKEYGTLSTRYGGTGSNQSEVGTGDIMSNRFRSFPNNFLYSGLFSGSSAYSRGSNGNYWSRSASNYSYSYYLNLNSTYLNPSNLSGKYYGFSVRCLIGS